MLKWILVAIAFTAVAMQWFVFEWASTWYYVSGVLGIAVASCGAFVCWCEMQKARMLRQHPDWYNHGMREVLDWFEEEVAKIADKSPGKFQREARKLWHIREIWIHTMNCLLFHYYSDDDLCRMYRGPKRDFGLWLEYECTELRIREARIARSNAWVAEQGIA